MNWGVASGSRLIEIELSIRWDYDIYFFINGSGLLGVIYEPLGILLHDLLPPNGMDEFAVKGNVHDGDSLKRNGL